MRYFNSYLILVTLDLFNMSHEPNKASLATDDGPLGPKRVWNKTSIVSVGYLFLVSLIRN
jgi:hypothetical protein